MKTTLVFALLIALVGLAVTPVAAMDLTHVYVPTFSIVEVVTDQSVTIKTYNFPANDVFTVTMGAMGTKGVGGVVVGTTNSGSGGSFVVTYSIPSSLKGSYQIAIRLESPTSGHYAYNWFYNNTSNVPNPPVPPPGYTGYPYFFILEVEKDKSVTIDAYNFPANDTFKVFMGPYGSQGKGGTQVGSTNTGEGGKFKATYNIPAGLVGSYRIAIRLESPTSGYFAYNWFYNNSTTAPVPPPATPQPPSSGYVGTPYFFIDSVTKDVQVIIKAYNFPANDTFTVTMGNYGKQGVGGAVVGSTNTGSGGSFSATYNIPSSLAGSYRIAIRLQSPTSGYYAYNWFYNNSTP